MARRAEGWRLTLDERTGIYGVRWRRAGQRFHHSTGERDSGAAQEVAARIYAEAVSGRRQVGGPSPARALVADLGGEWLGDIEAEADVLTVRAYTYYVAAWSGFFGTLDKITGPVIEDFWRARLREVKRKTVIKQLYTLNLFLRWLEARHFIDAIPAYHMPPKSSTGTPADRREVETVPLSLVEVDRIIAALPELSRKKRDTGTKWRVRDHVIVAWETGLRPATLDELTAPGDYRRGDATLRIRAEADKARFGREVPLTGRARDALDRSAPDVGPIFGKVDSHAAARYLRIAAEAAGIDAEKAARIKPYDLRHGRGTQLVEDSGNIVGVAFLFGHKAVTTTNRYVHAHRAAAEQALAAASIGTDSGRAKKSGRSKKR